MSRRIDSGTAQLLVTAGDTHVAAAEACIKQAEEQLRLAKEVGEDDARTIDLTRAIHELEAAVHTAALTQVTCTVALLEALDVDPQQLRRAFRSGSLGRD